MRWTYGAGAVLALLQNVAVVVGVFAWTGKPIDGIFLAAILTIIGYTVNDSVVVFDRIRETRNARAIVQVATQLAESNLDVWVNPATMTLRAYKRKGSDLSATVALTLGADDGTLKAYETTKAVARRTRVIGPAKPLAGDDKRRNGS